MINRIRNKFSFGLSLAVVLALLLASLALADDISNNLDASIDAEAEVMPLNVDGANGTTQLYVTQRNGDGKNGCNFTGHTTLVVSVSSSDTSVATVSPSSVTFGSCGDSHTLTVTPHNQGSATISVSQISNNTGGSFNLAPATFIVNVTPPPNTPPQVSIEGVEGGASYEIGSVPAATCRVIDAEDGNSSFAATLGVVTGPLAAYGLGEQIASCSYTDAGGLTASASLTYSIVDTTAPVITFVSRTEANDYGWNKDNVTVNWSCSDSGSGVLAASVSQTVSSEGENQSATGTCADHAGNTASDIQSGINIDKTAPVVTAALDLSPAPSGWFNSSTGAPKVVFTCSDATSGVASCPSDHTFGEGENQSHSGTAFDKAGNSASAGVSDVDVDLTAPTVSATLDRSPGATGWFNSSTGAPVLEFTCSDDTSGVASCPSPYTFGEGENQSRSATVYDYAGNSASTGVSDVDVDLTAPTILGSASPGPNGNGWNKTDVIVSFTCGDAMSGVATCGPDQTLTGEGADQSATGTAVDNAGNSATATVGGINIDKTAPTASASRLPAANTFGWNNGAVTVSFDGSDSLSDLDYCDDPIILSGEGAGQSAAGYCYDKAGNVSDPAEITGINIDLTPPTVALIGGPADGGSYYFGYVPPAPTCSAEDSLSDIDGSCAVSGHGTGLGSHTVTAAATDKAGNSASASATYTVLAWELKGFYQPVDMNGVYNVVKNGSTVPLKFEIFAGAMELTDVSSIKSLVYGPTTCGANAITDEIETTATGGTALRYDATGGQFIYNWKTPSAAGKCYGVTMTTWDGSKLVAYFKLK